MANNKFLFMFVKIVVADMCSLKTEIVIKQKLSLNVTINDSRLTRCNACNIDEANKQWLHASFIFVCIDK